VSNYHYNINATWRVEPTSPAVLGKKFLGVLDAISNAVPGIGDWQLAKPPYRDEYVTVDEARAKPAEWVENNPATHDEIPTPESGYKLMALNAGPAFSPKKVGLTARVGGTIGDTIRFGVGFVQVPSDLETATYLLFRTALLAIIAQFPSVWANAYLYAAGYKDKSLAPGIPPHPATEYNRPWLSYLCAPLTKGLVPPVGVPCERTADGGLLMIAAEERLDPTNPDHMRRSRAMAQVMIARAGYPRSRPGWWSIDEEWPPTEEALRRRGPPKDP